MFPPTDPPRGEAAPYGAAARRSATVFGAAVELVWVPERARRRGAGEAPPPFRPSPVAGILEREALASGRGLVLTPNRHPFAENHFLLWSEGPTREASPELLTALFEAASHWRGTALVNTVGAAATIPHAHGHLTTERLPFLDALPTSSWELPGVDGLSDVTAVRAAPPVPLLIGLRGSPRARARAVHELQLARLTPAFNLVATGETTWLWPRSRVETPAPHFPYRVGAAELWGRWCFLDEASWSSATGADLEQALLLCGVTDQAS